MNEEKRKKIEKDILSLEKINNRSSHYTNQEMIQKIMDIIDREVKNEI